MSKIRDNEIAAIHNDLRDTAKKYHNAQQLRERLISVIEPLELRITELENFIHRLLGEFVINGGEKKEWGEAQFGIKGQNSYTGGQRCMLTSIPRMLGKTHEQIKEEMAAFNEAFGETTE